MDFTHFTAGGDDDGRRLDRILKTILDESSLSSLYKSIRKGLIKLNGKKCTPETKVLTNDDIQIASFLLQKSKEGETKNKSVSPSPLESKIILLRTEDLLILNKPYDIAVHTSKNGKPSLSDTVRKDYEALHREKTSLSFKCGPLHRLDRKTSGIIVFSQSLKGAKWFSEAIKKHRPRKIYLGICEGDMKESYIWNDKISCKENEGNNIEEKSKESFKTVRIAEDDGKSKNAVTKAAPVAKGIINGRKITLVKFEIETGRKHQIRLQSSYHGFPLLGDTAYNGTKINPSFFTSNGIKGRDFYLHAYELIFPEEGRLSALPPMITSPLPDDFSSFLSKTLIKPVLKDIL